ncbi:O-antigen ligase family protein [Flavobacterium antarcticum]|nr:O-antigen ligase family protein [Flavobacterium antarcticum]
MKSELSDPNRHIYFLALLIVTLPLNFAVGSISVIIFLVSVIVNFKYWNFSFNKALILPILLYAIMMLSLIWTNDYDATLSALKKSIIFLLIPAAFLVIPKLDTNNISKIFKIFSYSMVFYAVYFFILAIYKFTATQNPNVFFSHELVSLDLNAIYMASFASFAMFYFVSLEIKNSIERLAMFTLLLFVFLLSSRSLFFIDLILLICYYIFFSKTHQGVKVITVFAFFLFFLVSVASSEEIKDRLLSKSETAFVDNILNKNISEQEKRENNITIEEAWNRQDFQQNNFFPGTALRVFQVRVFKEMLDEQNIFFTGFGLGASQPEIEKKVEEHQLSLGYKIFNFHNQYIQTFAELGFFGFLTLILMLLVNLKNAIYNQNFLHLVFAVTMIILLLTESMFCRQRGIIFFIVLYCIFNSMEHIKPIKVKA